MRILYISQYFPPEAGATQTRAYEMACNLVRLGHQVTMLTEVPNHPSGIIQPAYRGILYNRSTLDGIDVVRVWVKASPVKNFRNRMVFYLTFMVHSAIAGVLLSRGRYDVIYASSPPLFVGGSALFLSSMRRIPMVFEVRDLWPESAVALGELSNRRAILIGRRLEEACYRRAKRIVVVTQGIQDRLKERGIAAEKIALIPNGANVDLFQFHPEGRKRLREELGLDGKFVAIYAGIHGLAQGLESIVEAARLIQEKENVHFIFIGDGPKKAELTQLVQQSDLTNLTLLPEKPREVIPDYLSAADVALIPLRNMELFKGALPSKMFDAWACQRPVLLSVNGEARRVMEQAQGGIFVPPEEPHSLVKALLQLRSSPEACEVMGKNGREFTERHYSRQALAEQLARLLEDIS